MIHHRPRQVRPTSRIDFSIPRAVFRAAQWLVLIVGTIAALVSSVSGVVSAGRGGAVAALVAFVSTALYTILSYAALAGILAVFQIADDVRDQLELDLQLAGRGEVDG